MSNLPLCADTTGVVGPGCWPPLAGGPYRAPFAEVLPALAQASPWWRREACRRAVVGGIRRIWRRVHGSSHVAPSCSCRWNGLSGSDRPGRYISPPFSEKEMVTYHFCPLSSSYILLIIYAERMIAISSAKPIRTSMLRISRRRCPTAVPAARLFLERCRDPGFKGFS